MEVENKYYQIYIDSIIDLASSVVLKCGSTARLVNDWVVGYTNASFDLNNPRTWKYYRNICGEYFQSDEIMRITSLDSLAEIEFSKESLEFHRATKKAYAFGTTYYKELVERYPEQENLIRGILYPADLETAIDAYDGQILAYPENLVESTEPSLIPKFQAWIDGFYRRWHNVQFQNTDNLYLPGMLAVLYVNMPGAIENIRLGHCHTHEVHSYHIQQYLASHSKLDRYLPYMTRSQAMFFYHNVAWVESNNGRQEIFDILLKRVFTDRNLPMGHFTLMHSTEGMMENDRLTPLVVFNKKPLNTPVNADNKDIYTLNEVLNIEDEIHRNNALYREEEQPKIEETATYTLNPNVPTKLLQSTVIDYTDSERYRMTDVTFQHWLWLAWNGRYEAFVSFVIPANGIRMSLTPIDAFAFYAYAFCKGMGLTIDNLPTVVCNRVQRIPLPSLDSMRAVCEKKHVSDQFLMEARATMPPVNTMISLEAFRNHCTELFNAANTQFSMTALEEGMTARGQKETAVARLWCDNKFTLGDYPDQNYADWFTSRNIVVKDLTESQLLEVANVIMSEAMGVNLGTSITLKDIQRAMCNLLLDLSSYSIQIGLNINTGPVLHAGFIQVRPDNIDLKTESTIRYQPPLVDFTNIKASEKYRFNYELDKYSELKVSSIHIQEKRQYDLPNAIIELGKNDARTKISRRTSLNIGYTPIYEVTAPNPRKLTLVPGMEKFLALPLDVQIASYVDTWGK